MLSKVLKGIRNVHALMGKTKCAVLFAGMLGCVHVCSARSFNVAEFGAIGSDMLDDSEALQLALNQAQGATSEVEVYVPAGQYHIKQPLLIFSNTSLKLDHGATIIKDPSEYTVMLVGRHLNSDGTPCYGTSTCPHGGYSQLKNITISGGAWVAGSNSHEDNSVFYLIHGRNIVIKDTIIRHSTLHMVNLSAGCDLCVENVVFADAWDRTDPDDYVTVEALHLDAATEDGEPGGFPLDGTPCKNVHVVGCVFTNVFAGVGTHHVVDGSIFRGLTVENCSFAGLKSYAIHAYGMIDCKVRGNHAEDCAGFVRSSSSRCDVSGNNALAMREIAFYDNGSTITVSSNVIDGCGVLIDDSSHGIYAVGSNLLVTDNEIRNVKGCGIRADEAATVIAQGNAIAILTGYGFSFTGTSSLWAVSNTVSDSGMAGVIITGGGSATLLGNVVSSPATVGIQLEDVAGVKLFDNSVTSSGSHGVWLKGCSGAVLVENEIDGLVNGHGVIVQGGSVEVVGNEIVCVSATKNGISAEDSAVVTARGNSIEGGLYGFCATAGAQLVAEGNDVSNVKNTAFYLANLDHPVVSGNIVSAPGNCGVQVLQTAGAAIRGNEITLSNGRGVLLTNSTGCEVSGNVIDGTDQEGIYCLESTGAVISGNLVSAALGIGIRVEGSAATAASADVVGNRVQSSSAHDIRICDNCSSCRLTENICTGSAATIAYSVIGSTTYRPGDVPCSAVKNEDGTIFVRWERQAPVSGYENGYLLDYGNDADFSGCATVEISDRDTVNYSLPPGSAKYVRVRSYHVYYGAVRYESTGSAGFDVPIGEAKVVFDDCGGAGGPGELSVPFGDVVPQLLSFPTREGHAFAGYWTEPMGRGVNYVRADGVGAVSVEPDWLPSRLYAFWMLTADSVERPEISENPAPDPTPDPAPDPTPDPAPDPTPDPTPDPEPGPTPDPEPDPEYSAPQLYTTADTSSFAGNVTYVGWVRDATGALKGTLTVKIAKTNKKDGTCKPTISYIPFGGKKQTIKLDKSSYPVAGTKALLNIPGIGTLRLGGRSVMGVDVDVQAGADLTKLVETKAAAKARMAALAGVRTFALETEQGAAAFSVTVSKNGKGKLAGTLPDGTKVSLSAQGVLGGRVLAIPFAYSKKGSFGFVLWIGENGKTEISDMTSLRLASGRTLSAQLVAPSASHRLAPGTHSLGCELFAEPLPFVVEGSKWVLPRQNKRAVVDPNPYAAKLKFTEKTGIVKGSFSATPRGAAGVVKFTVNGVVVGSRFYGSAFNKGYGSLAVSAE